MRTSPRQYPGAGLPPGASMPDVPDYEGQRPYAEPVPNGTPLDQQYAGYGMPEVDDSAYARALYGDGGVHAGPGTGLGYTDASWAGAPYGGSYYGDPDTTDPDLASSAYGRAMYGDPGQAPPPLEDPALGHAGMGYGYANAGYGYGYDPATMPAPGYDDPDATGPMAGGRDQVDLAYYGPGGEPAYGYAQQQAAPAYVAPGYVITEFGGRKENLSSPEAEWALAPDDVAHAVESIVDQGPNSDIKEIVVQVRDRS